MRIHRSYASLLIWAMLALPAVSQGGTPNPAAPQRHPSTAPQPRTPAEVELEKQQMKQRNKERFARVKKDTDQLLKLATELKASVDEASEQTLSLEVIRKAEQIEKLAKEVREKMKGE